MKVDKNDRQLHLKINEELETKILKYASAHSMTKTDVCKMALNRFFKNTNEDHILRSLNKLQRRIKAVQHNNAVESEMLFSFMRIFMLYFPPLPQEELVKANEHLPERLYQTLLGVAENLKNDSRVISDVNQFMGELANDAVHSETVASS